MSSRYLIYGLLAKEADSSNVLNVRYVGKSCNGSKRPKEHGHPWALKGETPVYRWIRKLRRNGHDYSWVILEEFAGPDDLYTAEQFWIAQLRGSGNKLLNLNDGGAGNVGWKMSEKQKAHMRVIKTGKKASEATKQKMRDTRRGTKMSQKAIENSRAARLGSTHTREARVTISRKKGGRPFRDECGNRYDLLADAAKALGLDLSSISKVLRGEAKHTKNHIFTYLEAE